MSSTLNNIPPRTRMYLITSEDIWIKLPYNINKSDHNIKFGIFDLNFRLTLTTENLCGLFRSVFIHRQNTHVKSVFICERRSAK